MEHGKKSKLYIDEHRFRTHLRSLIQSDLLIVNDINGILQIQNSVHITIDDGYRNFYEIAFPILKEFQISATLFVPTEKVGKTCYEKDYNMVISYCSWDELKEMKDSGLVHIQPHGHKHIRLSDYSYDIQYLDISTSCHVLENNGFNPTHFCYPYGSFNDLTLKIIQEIGMKSACTTITGKAHENNDFHKLCRFAPNSRMDGNDLLQMLKS